MCKGGTGLQDFDVVMTGSLCGIAARAQCRDMRKKCGSYGGSLWTLPELSGPAGSPHLLHKIILADDGC